MKTRYVVVTDTSCYGFFPSIGAAEKWAEGNMITRGSWWVVPLTEIPRLER